MVWRQKGKRIWYGKLWSPTGWKDVSLGTRDRATAEAIQRLLDDLRHQRRWAILAAVGKQLTIGDLYDAAQRGDLDGILARLADVDLAPHVAPWQQAILANAKVTADTASQYLQKLRTLFPAGTPCLRSSLTPARCSSWLNALPVAPPTRRRYFAAAQSFFRYLIQIGVLTDSPLAKLDRPGSGEARTDWWLPQADMQRLCDSCHEPFRTLYALMYGTGIETSVACRIRRKQVDVAKREVFAPGTKNHNRKRTVRVAEWAWPYVEAQVRGLLPDARLFPWMTRGTARYQHAKATERCELPGFQLRDSRHSYAVRAAKAGTPPEIIARQLGHKDATMVLKVYGRFFPSSEERDHWEKIAAAMDAAATARATAAETRQ